jgi:heptosyltransferase I
MTSAAGDATAAQWTSLLIVRLSAMGDIIHTLPAVTALRQAFPHASIGWLIDERWAELLCTLRYPRAGRRSFERPLVDYVHTVNLSEWRRALLSFKTLQQMAIGLSELRGMKYGVAVDFQGAVRSALLARWSGAQAIFGDAEPRENAASMFYTRQVETSGRHVVEQALDLARAVVARAAGTVRLDEANACVPEEKSSVIEFPVDPDAEKKISCQTAALSSFAILNPGAGWGAKQWPPERYGAVARELARDGIHSLVNFGPGEEELASAVESASEGSARKISCSISELIALTRRARLLIGGDTGPMHLAAGLKIPVVAIFGPTNPARNGPFGTRSIVLRSASSLTDHSRRAEPELGLLEISAEEVTAAARKLLCEEGQANLA